MGSKNGKKPVRIHLTLTKMEDAFLSSAVETGKYLSKQDVVRSLIDKEMESAPA